jgi:hypothetical protein
LLGDDSYFTHVSRYIHLNPLDVGANYLQYPYSSLSAWLDGFSQPFWLKPERARGEFRSSKQYVDFLAEYEKVKEELALIKESLKE